MDFNPKKLETNFILPATKTWPICGRKYTLTHSDETAMMFLDVGIEYNYSAINPNLRDDVLGKWTLLDDNTYILFFYANVEVDDFNKAKKKYSIFKDHMEMALMAIFYGDIEFFKNYSCLMNTPIFVKFDSNFPMFNNYEFYGCVKDYVL